MRACVVYVSVSDPVFNDACNIATKQTQTNCDVQGITFMKVFLRIQGRKQDQN